MATAATRHDENVVPRADIELRHQPRSERCVRQRQHRVEISQLGTPDPGELQTFQQRWTACDELRICNPVLVEHPHPAPAIRFAPLPLPRADEDDARACSHGGTQLRSTARIVEYD